MADSGWFLTAAERGNPDTTIDRRHDGARPFTSGNELQLLVHGASYFPILHRCIDDLGAGDQLFFTDWRGDPDQRLGPDAPSVSSVIEDAARRQVVVKGLIWRSHLDRFSFSEQENRHLGEEINAAGGECLRDMRVRPGGSHHQKFVVLRHPAHPERDVAFVGGIDLCHSRLDDAGHGGDRQRQPMAAVYGPRPPWHDIQVAVRGPAVDDVEWVFRERWQDPAPLTRNPVDVIGDLVRGEDHTPGPLPPPQPRGTAHVQLLRTYPRRRPAYPFARQGERSVARGYTKALGRARRLILLEDQYLWSAEVVAPFVRALAENPDLQLIAVIPRYPDQDGRMSMPPNLIGRWRALRELYRAGGDRVAVYGLLNGQGTPIYVHAKVCVIDDVWASVGSDNLNRRSWTHDSELACAVIDEQRDEREPRVLDRFGDGARVFARNLRLELAAEHLGRGRDDIADLLDPAAMFTEFAAAAARLQNWMEHPVGARPPGQLVPYPMPQLSGFARLWTQLPYRFVYDPDGRPLRLRWRHRF
ncbi:MAG TPA: phospholipase D family protein [Jatrophihabitans sp.]|nr:phospholipase D family protein [Jatrophihabitans sp.]